MFQQMRSSAKWIWLFIVICFVGVFLFAETSGLLGIGSARITTSTAVAEVNGVEIPYLSWANLSNSLAKQEEQNTGRGLSLDERRQIEDLRPAPELAADVDGFVAQCGAVDRQRGKRHRAVDVDRHVWQTAGTVQLV